MKSYQSALVTIAFLFVAVCYTMITSRITEMSHLMFVILLATVWFLIALERNNKEEDRISANKYKTVTTTQEISEEDVPAFIVAHMKESMALDAQAIEGFEKSLQVEEIIIPDFVLDRIKSSMDIATDPLCAKLDSVLDELDNFPAAPKEECFVL